MTGQLRSIGPCNQRGDRRGLGFALAVAIIPLIGVSMGARAQSPSFPTPSQIEKGNDAVDLTMEQRHIVKEIIIKEMKIEPQPHAGTVPARVGGTVPSGTPLQPMPVEVTAKIPQLKTHSFLVQNEKVIVVDPRNNKVAALIE